MLGGLLVLLLLALQVAATTPRITEPGRTVVIHTQFGQIRIRLLEQLAPRITALVRPLWPLEAHQAGCGWLPGGRCLAQRRQCAVKRFASNHP